MTEPKVREVITAAKIASSLHFFENNIRSLCMENVFIPPSRWECDFLAVRPTSYYFTEFEIKLSREDYAADFRNKSFKHDWYQQGGVKIPIPKQFYFVTPEQLIEKVPDYCGLIWATNKEGRLLLRTIKEAPVLQHASKLTPKQIFNVGYKASSRLRYAKWMATNANGANDG